MGMIGGRRLSLSIIQTASCESIALLLLLYIHVFLCVAHSTRKS